MHQFRILQLHHKIMLKAKILLEAIPRAYKRPNGASLKIPRFSTGIFLQWPHQIHLYRKHIILPTIIEIVFSSKSLWQTIYDSYKFHVEYYRKSLDYHRTSFADLYVKWRGYSYRIFLYQDFAVVIYLY